MAHAVRTWNLNLNNVNMECLGCKRREAAGQGADIFRMTMMVSTGPNIFWSPRRLGNHERKKKSLLSPVCNTNKRTYMLRQGTRHCSNLGITEEDVDNTLLTNVCRGNPPHSEPIKAFYVSREDDIFYLFISSMVQTLLHRLAPNLVYSYMLEDISSCPTRNCSRFLKATQPVSLRIFQCSSLWANGMTSYHVQHAAGAIIRVARTTSLL
jgi:hypothetical protein